jgi:glycosyltransferase involved in cell wall biosynthesis
MKSNSIGNEHDNLLHQVAGMRFLVIPTGDWTRGPGRGHIDPIAEKLVERGHTVYVWYFDLFRGKVAKRPLVEGIVLVKPPTLPVRDTAMFFGLNGILQFPTMFRIMRKIDPDVVISENLLHGLFSFVASRRTVLKVFDFSDYFPQSASIYYSRSNAALRIAVEALVIFITRLSLKMSDVCLVPCVSLLRMTRRVDEKKPCYIVRNGVDFKLFNRSGYDLPIRRNLGLGDRVIVFVGLVESWLDFKTVLMGIQILRKTMADVQLLVVGPSSGKYQDEIRQMASELNVANSIVWAGWIPYEDMSAYIATAKCCVMPFRTDTALASIVLPLKLFEYSACGKPILSTSLAEVRATEAKHVFFYATPEDFAQKAEKLLSDDNRSELSEQAREFGKEHDFGTLANQLESIIAAHIRRCDKESH